MSHIKAEVMGKVIDAKTTKSGKGVNLTVPHTLRKKVNGEWVDDETVWVSVYCGRDWMDWAYKNVEPKNTWIVARGKASPGAYTARDGTTKLTMTVFADEVEVTEKPQPIGNGGGNQWQGGGRQSRGDEIPF